MSNKRAQKRALDAARLLEKMLEVSSEGGVASITPCSRCGVRPSGHRAERYNHVQYKGECWCRHCLGKVLIDEVLMFLDPPRVERVGPIEFWLAWYRPEWSVMCSASCHDCPWTGGGRSLDRDVVGIYRRHGGEGLACWRRAGLICRGAGLRLHRLGVAPIETNQRAIVSLDQALAIVRMSDGELVESVPAVLRQFRFVDVDGVLNEEGQLLARDMLGEVESRMLFDDEKGWVSKEVCGE